MTPLWKTVASIAFTTTVAFGISPQAEAASLGGNLTGDYKVGSTSYYLIDNSREETFTPEPGDKRELMVQVWYPTKTAGTPIPYWEDSVVRGYAETNGIPSDVRDELVKAFQLITPRATTGVPIANNQANFPVLFYSHGLGGLRQENTFLAEELASHGYIVVGIDHTYDAGATTFPDGRTVLQNQVLKGYVPESLAIQEVNLRATDAKFVLDELQRLNNNDSQGLLSSRLDLSKVGIFGHSFGGATAATAMLLDSRFQAGVNMDGNMWGDVVNVGVNRPFMIMNNSKNGMTNDRKSFYQNLQNDAYNLSVAGTEHLNFNDTPLQKSIFSNYYPPEVVNSLFPETGSIDSQRGAEIISAYNLAFFDKYLKGKDSPLLKGSLPNYPEVTLESHQTASVPEPSVLLGLMTISSAGFLVTKRGDNVA